MTVIVDLRCSGCGACLMTCPERALVAAPRRPVVLVDRCTTCMACVEVCPADAISLAAGTRVLQTREPRSPRSQAAAAGGGPSPAGLTRCDTTASESAG
jgi:ferredoxin